MFRTWTLSPISPFNIIYHLSLKHRKWYLGKYSYCMDMHTGLYSWSWNSSALSYKNTPVQCPHNCVCVLFVNITRIMYVWFSLQNLRLLCFQRNSVLKSHFIKLKESVFYPHDLERKHLRECKTAWSSTQLGTESGQGCKPFDSKPCHFYSMRTHVTCMTYY